ncbi:MAG: hypothetical protein K2W96_14965 [Gemmataceae bacterium]|nr:hypothetical protein [Gemmataceae bacterium]
MMLAILLAALLAGADPGPAGPPRGQPPRLEFVSVREGRIVQGPTEYKNVWETRFREVLRDGRVVVIPFAVMRRAPIATPAYTIINARFRTARGDKLTLDEAKKRIGGGALAVLAADRLPVDPKWLAALAPETLVVIPEPGGIVKSKFAPER